MANAKRFLASAGVGARWELQNPGEGNLCFPRPLGILGSLSLLPPSLGMSFSQVLWHLRSYWKNCAQKTCLPRGVSTAHCCPRCRGKRSLALQPRVTRSSEARTTGLHTFLIADTHLGRRWWWDRQSPAAGRVAAWAYQWVGNLPAEGG